MKKYRIKVNGKVYEVELEAVEEVKSSEGKTETKAEVTEKKNITLGSKDVLAPIGGNVISVNVKVGDSVKKGQCLVVIEAMKLENEVVSPEDGVVTSVNVSKGSAVQTSDLLIKIG